MNPSNLPYVILANPEVESDIYYLTGLMAPDPYIAVQNGDELSLVVSPLEYGRAVKESKADKVLDSSVLSKKANDLGLKELSPYSLQIIQLLKEANVDAIEVPQTFPLKVADELRANGISIYTYPDAMLRERVLKSDEEISKIKEAIRITEKCFERVRTILAESVIGDDQRLSWDGEFLTSERVHLEIERVCMNMRAEAKHPIVAGGIQACDPHERGHGVLRANELVIVDVFPRSKVTHYWGDLTRTFLKGNPSAEQIRLVKAVASAHQLAIDAVAEGVRLGDVHEKVEEYFDGQGYRTEKKDGVYQGFFHGTGHGFGLDIHEPPRLGKSQNAQLMAGMVVTVEPGLYYPEIGGCRIEDDVVVTKSGCEILSNAPYDWVIE